MIAWALSATDAIIACNLPDKWAGADREILTRRAGVRGITAWAARALLRAVLAQVTGRRDWLLRPDARGKPFAFLPDGSAGPFLSLSHSGQNVAVAVGSGGPLGIDVEMHRARDFARLAAYAFGPQEAVVAARRDADFYRLWTLREAMGKATGDGLRLAADGVDKILAPETAGVWLQDDWGLFSCTENSASLAIAQRVQKSEILAWNAAALSRLMLCDIA